VGPRQGNAENTKTSRKAQNLQFIDENHLKAVVQQKLLFFGVFSDVFVFFALWYFEFLIAEK
jgi:hypothetical protein